MISNADGLKLIQLARDSIQSKFSGKEPALKGYEKFSAEQGVFVTIHKDGRLRGCIGYPEPVIPLYRAIINASRASAFEDPRFPQLAEDELPNIKIELSILTVPKLLNVKSADEYLKKIEVGKDGLIIRNPYNSGLLLPQVPVEQGWNVKEFLFNTCIKAGLAPDAWTDLSNKLFTFQADIFSEK